MSRVKKSTPTSVEKDHRCRPDFDLSIELLRPFLPRTLSDRCQNDTSSRIRRGSQGNGRPDAL